MDSVEESKGNGEISSLMQGIEKEVIPWLQLADELHALNLDQELSVPQVWNIEH